MSRAFHAMPRLTSRSARRVSGATRRAGAPDVAHPEDAGTPCVPRAPARPIASPGEARLLALGWYAGAAGEEGPPAVTLHAAEGRGCGAAGLADRRRDRRPESDLRRRGRGGVRAPGRRRHAGRPRTSCQPSIAASSSKASPSRRRRSRSGSSRSASGCASWRSKRWRSSSVTSAPTGATEAALQTALRLLALDPLQEPVHRAVMRLYVAARPAGVGASAVPDLCRCPAARARRRAGNDDEAALSRDPSAAAIDATAAERRRARRRRSAVPAEVPRPARRDPAARAAARRARGGDRPAPGGSEPGVGGTRPGRGSDRRGGRRQESPLAEVAAEAVARGGRVLVGRCYEAEQILPFASWVDALPRRPPRWRKGGSREPRSSVADGAGAPPSRAGRSWARARSGSGGLSPALRERGAARPASRPAPAGDADPRGSPLGRRDESPSPVVRRAPTSDVATSSWWARPARRIWPARRSCAALLEDLARDEHLVELRLAPLSKEETLTLVRTLAPVGAQRGRDDRTRGAGLDHQRGQPVRGGRDRARASGRLRGRPIDEARRPEASS